MNQCLSVLFAVFLTLSLASCHTVKVLELPESEGFSYISKKYKNDDFTDVIEYVDDFKIRYPHSKYLSQLEFMQADSYFLSGSHQEAIDVYSDFLKRYPSSSHIPFSYYRIARSFDLQNPDRYEREQENGIKAIEKYSYYINSFPDSQWVDTAKKRLDILTRNLAQHNMHIANFYWSRENYDAALLRYINVVEKFPQEKDILKQAIARQAKCYIKLAEQLEKNPKSDASVFFINNTPKELKEKALEAKKKLSYLNS